MSVDFYKNFVWIQNRYGSKYIFEFVIEGIFREVELRRKELF